MSFLRSWPRRFALWIIFLIIGVIECLSHSVLTSVHRDAREPERDARSRTWRDSASCFYEPIACCQSADRAARTRALDDGKWGRAQHGKALKPPHGSRGLDRGRARRTIMLDGQSKAAMGITAYVVIVLAKASELVPRGGAKTLADVRSPTLSNRL